MLRKFLALDAIDRRLVVEALWIVSAVRIALFLLPFRIVLAMVRRRRDTTGSNVATQRIAWAVTAVARRGLDANCLTRNLAAMWLLARHGSSSTLHLGIAKDEDHLAAHAWLESGGRTILDAPQPGTFVVLGTAHR